MKRKTTPKIYKIQTFQPIAWRDGIGFVRTYTVAANRRSQAITVAGLREGEVVFKVTCLGAKLFDYEKWERSK